MIAPDGQVWAQAGVIAPSVSTMPRTRASFSANRMRETQKVHFSITPLVRTVTSGLSSNVRLPGKAYWSLSTSP